MLTNKPIIGQKTGKEYVIYQNLGSGGHGSVYLAEDYNLNNNEQPYIIKFAKEKKKKKKKNHIE